MLSLPCEVLLTNICHSCHYMSWVANQEDERQKASASGGHTGLLTQFSIRSQRHGVMCKTAFEFRLSFLKAARR